MSAFFKHQLPNMVTIATKTDERWHRSPIIIHGSNGFYFAEFNAPKQLYEFLKLTGCKVYFREMHDAPWGGKFIRGELSYTVVDGTSLSFWSDSLHQLPEGKQSVKLLSNGHIVDGYIYNDGDKLWVYRPNPNDPAVYKPLTTEEHIAWHKAHGSF